MLENVFDICKKVVNHYIKLMLSEKLPIKKLMSSKQLPNVYGLEGGQWKDKLYKQASSITRSDIKRTKERIYKRYKLAYKYFKSKGKQKVFLSKKFSELNINHKKRMKFDLKNFSLEIDERMCDLQKGNSFDWFLNIKTPFIKSGMKRNRISINIPIKEHKHSLKFKEWERKKTVHLSKDEQGRFYVSFCYEKENTEISNQNMIAFDIGYKKLIASSDGKFYGCHLEKLYKNISNKKRGSKNYKQSVIHKNNEIERVLNSIDFSNIGNVIVEDLKNVKHKSKLSSKFNNKLQYWTYSRVLSKLERLGEEKGFFVTRVDPAFTSQICSNCGVQEKENRKGETYSCSSCGMIKDADYNASINILHRGICGSPANNDHSIDHIG